MVLNKEVSFLRLIGEASLIHNTQIDALQESEYNEAGTVKRTVLDDHVIDVKSFRLKLLVSSRSFENSARCC